MLKKLEEVFERNDTIVKHQEDDMEAYFEANKHRVMNIIESVQPRHIERDKIDPDLNVNRITPVEEKIVQQREASMYGEAVDVPNSRKYKSNDYSRLQNKMNSTDELNVGHKFVPAQSEPIALENQHKFVPKVESDMICDSSNHQKQDETSSIGSVLKQFAKQQVLSSLPQQ